VHTQVIVNSDAIIGLAAGTEGKAQGVVVIAGTGMICLGKVGNYPPIRAGGWG
jgi:N-acetylglucosamine kinase-like BadF-type ATPase